MKRYILLKISNPNIGKIQQLLTQIKDVTHAPFTYMKQASAEYAKNLFLNTENAACFKTKRKTLFEATVWVLISNEALRVTNITSEKNTDLSISNYNKVLNAFYDEFVSNYIDDTFNVNLSDENIDIADILDKKTLDKLKLWENTCNKNRPLDHFVDRTNWLNFIIEYYDNKDNLSPDELVKWLLEDCNWDTDVLRPIAQNLGEKFEFGIDLLNQYFLRHEEEK